MTFTFNFKRVYVWELPVRFFHWITVLSIIILIPTGLIIADPPAIDSIIEPTFLHRMAWVRVIHFTFAYILIANVLVRLYWSFKGNIYANWRNFFPYTKKGLKNMLYVLKVDILLLPDKEHKLSNISIGHNYFAAFSYSIMMIFFLLQAITGLGLLSDTSGWWFPKLFSWVPAFLGGDIVTRYLHHIFTWIFLAFIVIHVYLVLYHDVIEARGEASAMISGYKFVRAERIDISEDEIHDQVRRQMWSGGEEELRTSENNKTGKKEE